MSSCKSMMSLLFRFELPTRKYVGDWTGGMRAQARHLFLKTTLGQLNSQVSAINSAVAQHPGLLKDAVNTLDASIAQRHDDSDHFIRSSQQEIVKQ